MVRDTDDPETTRVALRIRRCNARSCGERAVALEGPNTDCPFCHVAMEGRGKLRYATGDVQTVELRKDRIADIADSEIVERGDK